MTLHSGSRGILYTAPPAADESESEPVAESAANTAAADD